MLVCVLRAFLATGRSPLRGVLAAWLIIAPLLATPSLAQKLYGPGVSDETIVIGQTMPYSGPVSAFGTMGKAQLAYFEMINQRGGINGRKIKLISLDDAYSPPKTVEQTRRLVEAEEVLLIFSSFGAPTNTAVIKYLNQKQVPQLFMAATGLKWGDARNFAWSMSFLPSQKTATAHFLKHLQGAKPTAKIAVLYANDDFGKDYFRALQDLLGKDAATRIVSSESYESSDATVDSQVLALKGSGAEVLFNFASPKFAAQAIRRAYDSGWRPLMFVPYTTTSVSAVLQPAGLEKSLGIVSAAYLKDPSDPQWHNDAPTRAWRDWMRQYYPGGNVAEIYNVYAYAAAEMLVHVLKQCGDNLTRANVMKQAASLNRVSVSMFLPGISASTSATDFDPIKQMRLIRFDGQQWNLLDAAP